MRGKIISIYVCVLIVLALFVGVDFGFEHELTVKGATITVDASGWADYPAIQEAVDAAIDGDTVFVKSGEYFEHIIIDKSISLRGEDRDTTVIHGRDVGDVVTVVSDNVSISEFTVSHSGTKYTNMAPGRDSGDAGIQIDSDNNLVYDCLFFYDYFSIYLNYSCGNNIYRNSFKDCTEVCWTVYSHNNSFHNNMAVGNKEGMNFFWSDNNIIKKNFVANPIYYHSGIHLVGSSHNEVLYNTVHYAWQGYYIESSSNNNYIYGNNASYNKYGIRLARSHYNDVVGNTVYGNHECGFLFITSTNNDIYHNNIVSNTKQAQDHSDINYWDNGYPSGGNYWSDYRGKDLLRGPNQDDPGSDGIGDVSYPIPTDSFDRYPLMEPYSGDETPSHPPVASAGPNQSVIINSIVDFNGSDTYDIDGSIIKYKWDFGDGSPFGNGVTTAHAYNATGLYTVTLTVTDDEGYNDTDTCTITASLPVFLSQGWNLVSIPLVQTDPGLHAVLLSIEGDYDAVQRYDAWDDKNEWKHNHIFKPAKLNDLQEIDHTMGIWIHITKPGETTLHIQGSAPNGQPTIALYKGWNLVGYPTLHTQTRAAALNNLVYENQVDAVWTFDSAWQQWEEIGPTDLFETGKGYWIHVTHDCVWEVPSNTPSS